MTPATLSPTEERSSHSMSVDVAGQGLGSIMGFENKYFYDSDHAFTYVVYVDVVLTEEERHRTIIILNFATFLEIQDIIGITKIGSGRCKLIFKNAPSTNNFVRDVRVAGLGYQPKIFAHFVSTMGTVFL